MTGKRKIKGSSHASPQQREAELLAAARACFARDGYSGTTIDKIAAEAGLSKGSVYRFFKTKDDILLALLDAYEADFSARLKRVVSTAESALEGIRLFLVFLFDMSAEQSDMGKVWIEFIHQDVSRNRFTELRETAKHALEGIVELGVKKGELKVVPADAIIDLVITIHEGVMVQAIVDEGFDAISRFERLWPLLASGIKAP